MITVGIDQSFTSTGVCVFEDGELINRYLITSLKTDTMFDRAASVAMQVSTIVQKYKADVVALEGIPFMSKSNVTRDLAGLQYAIVIELIEYQVGDNLFIVPPSQVKKFATDTGKAKKEDMYEALPDDIRNEFGKVPKTKGRYDLTDAYFIGKLGEMKYGAK